MTKYIHGTSVIKTIVLTCIYFLRNVRFYVTYFITCSAPSSHSSVHMYMCVRGKNHQQYYTIYISICMSEICIIPLCFTYMVFFYLVVETRIIWEYTAILKDTCLILFTMIL